MISMGLTLKSMRLSSPMTVNIKNMEELLDTHVGHLLMRFYALPFVRNESRGPMNRELPLDTVLLMATWGGLTRKLDYQHVQASMLVIVHRGPCQDWRRRTP